MTHKVLIIGSGGREHALVWKLSQSSVVTKIFVAPGNAGMEDLAQRVTLHSHDAIVSFVRQESIDLTIIGQEVYLVEGLVDRLEREGFLAFGPSAASAQLEGSKGFAKDFMQRHHIPTAAYRQFTEVLPAEQFLETLKPPYVIKVDGLAAGKGVLICQTKEDARQQIHNILELHAFGDAGSSIVIEEFLKGEEASYFVISDGKNYITCPSAQDHKRIGELDTGLNTGGMGAYSPAPVVTASVEDLILKQVVEPTLKGMSEEGHPYKGVLYIGLMIDGGQPRVIEYNCRFGDPECQPLMMRLKSDLFPLLRASARGDLSTTQAEWDSRPTACVVLASEGYPENYPKGKIITGLDDNTENVMVFHAGTVKDGPVYRTNGGRVVGVTGMGNTLENAVAAAYDRIRNIHWDGMVYRRDIGLKGLCHFKDGRATKSVAIMIGSQSDLEIAKKATAVLDQFGVGYSLCVTSAHRTPERTREFMHKAEVAGVEVFIAMAGMAAHLPGVAASETTRPVIGVPILSSLQGMDALLAIAQMPPGIPVSTMAINGSVNAALSAIQMLSIRYTDLRARMKLYRLEMAQKVAQAHQDAGLETL
ncbi:MAG: phosphoribosylamine--glycine ligase [SAR324 cluster bacterium]|nr:phosphoribosylamine--glycine ligase [SAR324 cluster bacterium]